MQDLFQNKNAKFSEKSVENMKKLKESDVNLMKNKIYIHESELDKNKTQSSMIDNHLFGKSNMADDEMSKMPGFLHCSCINGKKVCKSEFGVRHFVFTNEIKPNKQMDRSLQLKIDKINEHEFVKSVALDLVGDCEVKLFEKSKVVTISDSDSGYSGIAESPLSPTSIYGVTSNFKLEGHENCCFGDLLACTKLKWQQKVSNFYLLILFMSPLLSWTKV